MAIARIEGRCDDQLFLPDELGNGRVIFADVCSRAIANALPLTSDYRFIQHSPTRLEIVADCMQGELEKACEQLRALFALHGVATEQLEWRLTVQQMVPQLDRKRRRIIRQVGE